MPARTPPADTDPGPATEPVTPLSREARRPASAPAPGQPERPLEWDQLPTPIAVISADGQLQRANRAFTLLLLSSSGTTDATPLDWLARFTPDARATLFTALADRRQSLPPLAWTRGRQEAPRWFSVTLRWRHTGTRCVALFHDITLLRQAELRAREQGEQLRSMANALPGRVAAFDANSLRCIYGNRAFAATFRLDEHQIVGRTMADIFGPEAWRDAQPAVDQFRTTSARTEYEQCVTSVHNETRRYTVRLYPQADAPGGMRILLAMEDVTRQRELERAMSESEQRLARFMQAAMEGIVLHHDGHVFDANPALCELVGRSLHELLGRALTDLVPTTEQPRWQHLLAQADAHAQADAEAGELGAADRMESQLLHADGSSIPVEVIVRAGDDAEPLGMLVLRDIRDRRAVQARMHYLAHHDALTGLPNRQAFLAQLEHLMVSAQASSTQLGLLFIDLDHFKRVNDSVGHAVADRQLKTIAQRIGEQVRSTDRLARFGGDEFMVLLPGLRDTQDAINVANKLLAAIAQPIQIEGGPISVTASVGIALYPRDGTTPDMLIKHADTAMHSAKDRGRATLAEFDPGVAASAYANLVLEGQLGQAVEQSEFELLFQPQVCANDGRLTGVEALIRWRHPQRGLLSPDEFIALAEQHRLMLPIGDWVLQEAARCARSWRQVPALREVTIAVNLSALQFHADDFIASIARSLTAAERPAGWLELELTERMLMDNLPDTLARLHRLREMGVRLSVDDFGTGYSSLAQLKLLPVDKMKIDRSFVQGLPNERDSVAIASAIVQLARGLGITAVAEGVETPEQQRWLTDTGCDQFQGLSISAPLNAGALMDWATQRAHGGAKG